MSCFIFNIIYMLYLHISKINPFPCVTTNEKIYVKLIPGCYDIST